jgi:GT2 family glycosyltransferase
MIDVSIIIPVFNCSKHTQRCLEYLSHLDSSHEIIVVDNASLDNTQKILSEQAKIFADESKPELVVITNKVNLGFGRSNNRAFAKARGDFVCFLNNDIKINNLKGWLTPMLVRASLSDAIVCLQGGVLDSSFNPLGEGHGLAQTKYWYMSGWCLVAKRDTFAKLVQNHRYDEESKSVVEGKALGPWNEKFFLYYEDGDLTWRAKDLGIPTIEQKTDDIVHIGRVTGRKHNAFVFLKKSKRIFSKIWKGR